MRGLLAAPLLPLVLCVLAAITVGVFAGWHVAIAVVLLVIAFEWFLVEYQR